MAFPRAFLAYSPLGTWTDYRPFGLHDFTVQLLHPDMKPHEMYGKSTCKKMTPRRSQVEVQQPKNCF